METVTNLASSASKAIWGDQTASKNTTQEPIAGETGDVKAGEPYDKGNIESSSTNPSQEPIAGETGNTKIGEPFDKGNQDSTETDRVLSTSASTNLPGTSTLEKADKPSSSNDTSGPGVSPSVGKDMLSAVDNTQKQQGADRPEDVPGGGASERISETKKEAELALGSGSRSTEQKSLGGGAGGIGDKKLGEELQKESQGEGTGEKYVKTSGVAADGGDFDAKKPGAGREADRLLEEKGIHHTPAVASVSKETKDSNPPDSPASGKDGKESKISHLKEKIKAKLHKS